MVLAVHNHKQLDVVSWQDKKLVTLLSTAVDVWAPNVHVLHKILGLYGKLLIPSSVIYVAYQEFMRGVDVTDEL